jgi:DNA-binding response OmpR family regulator
MELMSRRVLVVDEDDAAYERICDALKGTGALVMRARAAGEALLTLVGTTPDVVLVDLGLHGTGGMGLLRRLRSLETSKGGRVPAATTAGGLLADEDERRYREAGAQAHLTKPYDAGEVLAVVRALAGQQVDRRRTGGPRPARRPELRLAARA